MTTWTFEATSRTAKAGKLMLHYNEAGPTDGETIVFLHGSGPGASSWSNFHQNLPAFAQEHHRSEEFRVGEGCRSRCSPYY